MPGIKIYNFTLLFFVILSLNLSGQQPIEVFQSNIKIKGEETLYFGFAEGDIIIFSFSDNKKKDLKEVEVFEYPDKTKYSEYKTSKIENKQIRVGKTSIYGFRFKENNVFGDRICKVTIQRVPASSETLNFNTDVVEAIILDTVYSFVEKNILVGHDTSYVSEIKEEFVRNDTLLELITRKEAIRVHSETNLSNKNKTYVPIDIPSGFSYWVYSIGVSQESREQAKYSAEQSSKILKQAGNSNAVTSIVGMNAGLALYGLGYAIDFFKPVGKENVYYALTNSIEDANNFYNEKSFKYIKGDIKIAYTYDIVKPSLSGRVYFLLYNDNFRQGIDVDLEIIGYKVSPVFRKVPIKNMVVQPKYATKFFYTRKINQFSNLQFVEEVNNQKKIDDLYSKRSIELQALIKQNDYEKIVGKCKEMIILKESSEILNTLGWYLLLTKKYLEAKDCLEKGLMINPKNLYIIGNLAHVYLLIGEKSKAFDIYAKYKDYYVNDNLDWKQGVREDFDKFESLGIQVPFRKEVEDLIR